MFPRPPGAFVLAILLSLIPALLRWWWGRPLARRADDPLLPERLAAHNRRFGVVSGGCAALLVAGWPSWAIWSAPLLIVAQAAAGFPLRKTLYQETWSLAACLSFFARLTAAVFGFWMLLAFTPFLVSRAGRFEWIAAGGLAVVLGAWNWYSDIVLRRLLRTRPVTDPEIVARLEALVSACGLPMPRFEYVPMRGGVLANAVALPSLRGSSVIFTDTLLERLTADETIAICAHELAHLEYYDRARLRRLSAVNCLLIAGAAAITPVAQLLSGSPAFGPVVTLWPVAMIVALGLRARHRQQNETVSDLRAVALTGDGEALARALTTLHTVARVPRRWDQNRERQATHPSLARRIRDIRAAAGVSAAPLESSASFRAVSGGTLVTFEDRRLRWEEGQGTTHVLDYAALVELRLHASPTGAVTLVAAERRGRRWQMAPEAADLTALQGVLDVVDGGLTHDARPASLTPAVPRLIACLGWVLALVLGQLAFGFVALLASLSPAPSVLNGAGAAALATAALIIRDGSFTSRNPVGDAVVVGALGAVLLVLGRVRRDERARGTRAAFAVLGVCSVLAVATLGVGGVNLIRLHQGARSAPAATVLLAGLAAACWTARHRASLRYAAFAAALGAVAIGVLGSTMFLDRAARDPLLLAAAPITRTVLDVPAVLEFDVPFDADSLRLSPQGRLAAIVRADDDEDSARRAPNVFFAGRAGGTLSPLEAEDLVFIDERRALLLVMHDGAAEIRDVSVDGAPIVTWRLGIADLQWGTVSYDGRSNRWTLLGRDGAGRFVRATGRVRDNGIQRTIWSGPSKVSGWIDAIGARGAAMLAVEKTYPDPMGRMSMLWIAPWLWRNHSEARFWQLRDGTRVEASRSLLDTSCVGDALGDTRLVCTAFDGTRTRILAIDPESGSVSALAMMDGRFRAEDTPAPGWLSGWLRSTPVALRLATREWIRPPFPAGEYVHIVTATDAVVGTVTGTDDGSRVRLYRLPGASQALAR